MVKNPIPRSFLNTPLLNGPNGMWKFPLLNHGLVERVCLVLGGWDCRETHLQWPWLPSIPPPAGELIDRCKKKPRACLSVELDTSWTLPGPLHRPHHLTTRNILPHHSWHEMEPDIFASSKRSAVFREALRSQSRWSNQPMWSLEDWCRRTVGPSLFAVVICRGHANVMFTYVY